MKVISIIVLIFVTTSMSAVAQLNEGYIQFDIDVQAVDTSKNSQQSAAMMRNSKMEIFFAQDLSRVDFTLGQISQTSVRIDRKNNKGVSLSNNVMGKYANIGTADELAGEKVEVSTENVRITPFEEYKTILGFKCQKHVMDNNGVYTTYWITDQITIEGMSSQVVNPNLPGFPLAFTSINNGLRMHFQASNYKSEIPDKSAVFSTEVPEEYLLMEQN